MAKVRCRRIGAEGLGDRLVPEARGARGEAKGSGRTGAGGARPEEQ